MLIGGKFILSRRLCFVSVSSPLPFLSLLRIASYSSRAVALSKPPIGWSIALTRRGFQSEQDCDRMCRCATNANVPIVRLHDVFRDASHKLAS